jgi:MYXO-CTERM domain-containing protein
MRQVASLLTLALASTVCSAASAGTIAISGSGAWGPHTPSTTLSAPDATWSFTFDVPDPLPGTIDMYGEYTSTVSKSQYLLNGFAVNDTIESLTYYSAGPGPGGLFDINFAHGTLSLFGAQIYDSNLNLIPGVYGATIKDNLGSGQGIVIVGVVSEPSSMISGGLGLLTVLGLASVRRRLIRSG